MDGPEKKSIVGEQSVDFWRTWPIESEGSCNWDDFMTDYGP